MRVQMNDNRTPKREALRNRLIDAAEELIVENGLRGLKARDITAKAGCALGALYNAVEDLDQLVILVNSRTLARLGSALRDTVPEGASPADTLHALAQGYARFAQTHTNLWSTIFAHRLPEGVDAPDWHQAEYPVLIAEIIAPLAQLQPDLDRAQLHRRAQTLFAAVHGVVQLSIYGIYVGAPADELRQEVRALVTAMVDGIEKNLNS